MSKNARKTNGSHSRSRNDPSPEHYDSLSDHDGGDDNATTDDDKIYCHRCAISYHPDDFSAKQKKEFEPFCLRHTSTSCFNVSYSKPDKSAVGIRLHNVTRPLFEQLDEDDQLVPMISSRRSHRNDDFVVADDEEEDTDETSLSQESEVEKIDYSSWPCFNLKNYGHARCCCECGCALTSGQRVRGSKDQTTKIWRFKCFGACDIVLGTSESDNDDTHSKDNHDEESGSENDEIINIDEKNSDPEDNDENSSDHGDNHEIKICDPDSGTHPLATPSSASVSSSVQRRRRLVRNSSVSSDLALLDPVISATSPLTSILHRVDTLVLPMTSPTNVGVDGSARKLRRLHKTSETPISSTSIISTNTSCTTHTLNNSTASPHIVIEEVIVLSSDEEDDCDPVALRHMINEADEDNVNEVSDNSKLVTVTTKTTTGEMKRRMRFDDDE